MRLDWSKIGLFVCAGAIAGTMWAVWHSTPEVVPLPPERPVVEAVPAVEKLSPKPRPKAPAPMKKAIPPHRRPECAKVPAAAYQKPVDVVLFAAERYQLTPEQMTTLKKCINAPR